jgi:hypothetical protein
MKSLHWIQSLFNLEWSDILSSCACPFGACRSNFLKLPLTALSKALHFSSHGFFHYLFKIFLKDLRFFLLLKKDSLYSLWFICFCWYVLKTWLLTLACLVCYLLHYWNLIIFINISDYSLRLFFDVLHCLKMKWLHLFPQKFCYLYLT